MVGGRRELMAVVKATVVELVTVLMRVGIDAACSRRYVGHVPGLLFWFVRRSTH
jgi:hypothetical protein